MISEHTTVVKQQAKDMLRFFCKNSFELHGHSYLNSHTDAHFDNNSDTVVMHIDCYYIYLL